MKKKLTKDLQDICMKAKADNKFEKELWCLNYIKLLHEITAKKYEEITAYLATVKKFISCFI